MKPVVEIENLSKLYRLGSIGATSLRESLENFVRRGQPAPPTPSSGKMPPIASDRAGSEPNTFWALREVSFSVQPGAIVGVVGRNGAGKSTLLKILSRITEPTSGRAVLRGRVVSLLEVGTGFHQELSGRENIFLNGAILGMRRAEIAAKFDEIVEFSEVGGFIDTPVKRYSSGMFVRLAFAVAAHLEPEVLLIDEVLAVGDAGFQKKCLGKMGEVAAKQGRTVFFVSHNMGAVRSLCDEAIHIDGGRLIGRGQPDEIIRDYLAKTVPSGDSGSGEVVWRGNDAPGNDEVTLERVRLADSTGETLALFEADRPISVEISYRVKRRIAGVRFHLYLHTQEGELAFAATDHLFQPEAQTPGLYTTTGVIPGRLLNRRSYVLSVGCGIPGERWMVSDREVLAFTVSGAGNQSSHFPETWPGVVCPAMKWTVAERQPTPSFATV
ncbi:MAG: ABC transporter ATP-binding protein [Chthoniobacter sp.]|nr:ABC transporter ATP-binding protein [Chthoniobacter sp.]